MSKCFMEKHFLCISNTCQSHSDKVDCPIMIYAIYIAQILALLVGLFLYFRNRRQKIRDRLKRVDVGCVSEATRETVNNHTEFFRPNRLSGK